MCYFYLMVFLRRSNGSVIVAIAALLVAKVETFSGYRALLVLLTSKSKVPALSINFSHLFCFSFTLRVRPCRARFCRFSRL